MYMFVIIFGYFVFFAWLDFSDAIIIQVRRRKKKYLNHFDVVIDSSSSDFLPIHS